MKHPNKQSESGPLITSNLKDHKSSGHPLATGSISNFLNLIWGNRGIDIKYIFRAVNILVTNFVLLPFRTYEKIKWGNKINRSELHPSPIFILGHWRSGTTYLHQLLCQDSRLGYVSTLQTFAPDVCISGARILWPVFRALLPKKRPIDNVEMALEYPEEEEWAVGNLCRHSFYRGIVFPGSMRRNFDKISGLSNNHQSHQEWKRTYLSVLKKASLKMNNRRLVLKNPMNTIRIPDLLDMFPDAKFIHIYRNPYDTYYSACFFFSVMIKQYQLETITKQEIENNVFEIFSKMMNRYWEDKERIPSENLIEIKFEDLEDNPLETIEKIYHALKIPGFEDTKSSLQKYILSKTGYQKNRYAINKETNQKIYQHWQNIIDKLSYAPPAE